MHKSICFTIFLSLLIGCASSSQVYKGEVDPTPSLMPVLKESHGITTMKIDTWRHTSFQEGRSEALVVSSKWNAKKEKDVFQIDLKYLQYVLDENQERIGEEYGTATCFVSAQGQIIHVDVPVEENKSSEDRLIESFTGAKKDLRRLLIQSIINDTVPFFKKEKLVEPGMVVGRDMIEIGNYEFDVKPLSPGLIYRGVCNRDGEEALVVDFKDSTSAKGLTVNCKGHKIISKKNLICLDSLSVVTYRYSGTDILKMTSTTKCNYHLGTDEDWSAVW